MGCGFGEEVEAAGDEDEVGGLGVGEGGLFGYCGGGVGLAVQGVQACFLWRGVLAQWKISGAMIMVLWINVGGTETKT